MTSNQYGFHDRLHAAFPSQVVVDVTERCNLACVHCGHEAFARGELYTGADLPRDVHTELVRQIREDGRGITGYIRYTAQGEPLLHPHIFEFLTHARAASGTRVSLTTNGTLLTPDAVDKLLRTDIDIVDISIDAFSEASYAAIRRNGDYRIVVANVLHLLRERERAHAPLRIVTTFIEQEANAGEGAAFERFWKEAGADYVILRRLHSFGGYVEEQAAALRRLLRNHPRRPCLYPWERLCVTPRGDISFCPSSWTEAPHFATLRETSLAEAWQGPLMRQVRDAHLRNDYSLCPACADCPDWAATRWPHEGRSFADMVDDLCPRENENRT